MSGSNRSERFALIALLIFVLGITLTLSYQFGRDSGLLETEPHEHSNYYTDRTDVDIQGICGTKLTIVDAVKCTTKQKNQTTQANQEHRANHDLTAQRSMARYAWWIIVITVLIGGLTAFITGLGVYWVVQTLNETRNATKAAQQAVEATFDSFRAWAFVELKSEGTFIANGKSASLEIETRIVNEGKTPAFNCTVQYKICQSINGINLITTSENFFNEINGVKDIKRGIIVRTGTLNRGITNVIQTVFGHDINPNGDYFIMVRLTYKTANSDKWRVDGRVFNAQPVASPAFANHYSFAELSNYRYIT